MCQCALVQKFIKMRHPVHNFVRVIESTYYVTPCKPVGVRVDWNVTTWDTRYIIMCEWWTLQRMRQLVYHCLWVMDTSVCETPGISLFVSDGYINIWDTLYIIMCEWWILGRMRQPVYHCLWVMDTSVYETPGVTFVSDGYVNLWDTRYNIICEWWIRQFMRHPV